jgi:hypothetical protein
MMKFVISRMGLFGMLKKRSFGSIVRCFSLLFNFVIIDFGVVGGRPILVYHKKYLHLR